MAQRTRLQLRTEIAAILSLNLDDADELALIDLWIADGIEYLVAEGELRVAIAEATLTAGEGDYELDDDILRLLWIQSGSSGSQNEWQPESPSEILRLRLNASSSSPTLRFAVDGANMLMVYPVPATADTLTIRHVPRPPALTSDSDTPSWIPQEFQQHVTTYALWRSGDYDDDQTSAQGSRYKQQLDEAVKDMRGRVNRKRGRRLPPARLNRRNQSRIAHRNDQDI